MEIWMISLPISLRAGPQCQAKPLQYRLRQLEMNSIGCILHLRVSPLHLVALATAGRRNPSFTR